MEQSKPLSDLHQRYLSGHLNRKDFECLLFLNLLKSHERYRIIEPDLNCWNDFLSWLFPRLQRSIDLYRDIGLSFDSYINGLIYKASKEYHVRENDHCLVEHVCWKEQSHEMEVCEYNPDYGEEYCGDNSILRKIKPKHILILLLKNYHFVSDEYVRHISLALGFKSDAVFGMIDKLRLLCSDKEVKIESLRSRLYCQHYRCLAYQQRLKSAEQGSFYREKLKCRCERAKKRFLSMKKRLSNMRHDAPNWMIASVLGIPKGTVDSGLFALKRRFLGGHFQN